MITPQREREKERESVWVVGGAMKPSISIDLPGWCTLRKDTANTDDEVSATYYCCTHCNLRLVV